MAPLGLGRLRRVVINWNDPYRVLATYVFSDINRATDGGTRYNYSGVPIALPAGDDALFYAPLVGTPPSATPAEANRVAFGSRRVWISDAFGGGWTSIPANNATDDLGSRVRSLRFASFTTLYAGTLGGRVYRFTQAGGTWTRTRIDTATITTRVYVQVHNRGVTPADNVRVMLLLANASAGLPNLPFGFATNVQNGTPINTADWKTVGFATLNDVRVGFPKIAAFNLTLDLLPPPTNLAGNDHHCVLALLHHASDPFTATQTVTDLMSPSERKAAHKNLKVVQFTGTLSSPPVTMAVRIHNPSVRRKVMSTLLVRLNGYRGKVRLYLPKITTSGDLQGQVEGGKLGQDYDPFRGWAEKYLKSIDEALNSNRPWNKDWSKQRIADVHTALESGLMITATTGANLKVKNIVLSPGERHTVFLMFDRIANAKTSMYVPIEVLQLEARSERVVGGLNARVEYVPAPKRGARSAKPARVADSRRVHGGPG